MSRPGGGDGDDPCSKRTVPTAPRPPVIDPGDEIFFFCPAEGQLLVERGRYPDLTPEITVGIDWGYHPPDDPRQRVIVLGQADTGGNTAQLDGVEVHVAREQLDDLIDALQRMKAVLEAEKLR